MRVLRAVEKQVAWIRGGRASRGGVEQAGGNERFHHQLGAETNGAGAQRRPNCASCTKRPCGRCKKPDPPAAEGTVRRGHAIPRRPRRRADRERSLRRRVLLWRRELRPRAARLRPRTWAAILSARGYCLGVFSNNICKGESGS